MSAGIISSAYQFDTLADRTGLGGRRMGAIDIVAGKVDQVLHQLAAAANKRTSHPKRLAKGAHLDVHAARVNPLRRQGAAPLWPQHAEAVGIIDHQPVAALGCECCELAPGALIPVHAEDPFRDDQAPVWLELTLKRGHVVVTEALHPAGELAAHLLQGGVVEPVLPQQVLLAEQGLEHRLIGRETAVEQQHSLHPDPVGKRLFQLLVGTAVTCHQGRGASARTIAVDPRFEGGLDGGVIGEPQVIVGGEIEVVAPIDHQPGASGAIGGDAAAQQGRLLAPGQRLPQRKGACDNRGSHGRTAPARGRVAS
ncbi:hypothetical protein D3C71_1406690 [compost metagenome]